MNDLSDKGISATFDDGQALFSFLGSFWSHVYEDPDFIRRFCESIGLFSSQLELKKKEAKAASSRVLLPVYSRERWLCVKLSKDGLSAGNTAKPVLSSNALDDFGEAQRAIGGGSFIGDLNPELGTVYEIPKYVISASSVHERAFDPEISMLPGSDFVIKDGFIYFRFSKDPSTNPAFKESQDGDGVVIWLKDAMVDNNHVEDYAGYVVGMPFKSSRRNLDIVNAFWDLLNKGPVVSCLQYFVCKVLGVPCIEDDYETVKETSFLANAKFFVRTTTHSYICDIEPSVSVGQQLVHGTPLTDAVVFSDGRKLVETPHDVLFLKQSFFSDDILSGLGFSSDASDIVFCGGTPDRPRLKFDIYGDSRAVDTFFESCWRRCEEAGINMADLLGVDMPQSELSPGDVVPTDEPFIPMKFMRNNLVGVNIASVKIDLSKLDDEGVSAAGILSRSYEIIPPGVCLMFCFSPKTIADDYDCSGIVDD